MTAKRTNLADYHFAGSNTSSPQEPITYGPKLTSSQFLLQNETGHPFTVEFILQPQILRITINSSVTTGKTMGFLNCP